MADLGRPDTYQGAEGVVDLIKADLLGVNGTLSFQAQFYETTGDLLWRPRYFSIVGHAVGGSVGSLVLTFQALYGASRPRQSFPASGGLVAAADVNVQHGEDFLYTWSTEVADNYSNKDDDFGRIWVGGLPLVYLPVATQFSLLVSTVGGFDGAWTLEDGHMQLERFQPDAVVGANTPGGSGVYLLSYGG